MSIIQNTNDFLILVSVSDHYHIQRIALEIPKEVVEKLEILQNDDHVGQTTPLGKQREHRHNKESLEQLDNDLQRQSVEKNPKHQKDHDQKENDPLRVGHCFFVSMLLVSSLVRANYFLEKLLFNIPNYKVLLNFALFFLLMRLGSFKYSR